MKIMVAIQEFSLILIEEQIITKYLTGGFVFDILE